MQLFLHTPAQVRIINAEQEWRGTPADFAAIAPTYPGLPDGITERYWTPDYSYLQGPGQWITPDPVNCLPWIENLSAYQASGVVWVLVTLSKNTLCVNATPPDSLAFAAAFKASNDPAADPLLVDHEWHIRLRHEDGMIFDAFRAEFVNGVCAATYTYQDGIPLGYWALREDDIDRVQVGAQWYQVKLIAPVNFTLYREL
jgi:hypothetical protein